MNISKPLGIALLGLALGIVGTSTAFAKAHDQGVADGTRIDPSNLRGGGVAGTDVPGVGRDDEGNFLGVAADLALDMNYGQDVVTAVQVPTDTRRVKPQENELGFPPGQNDQPRGQ